MIIHTEGMKKIERDSMQSVEELMEKAGTVVADHIRNEIKDTDRIVILAGTGNNGGDGFVIARCLKDHDVRLILVGGKPKTEAAILNYKRLKHKHLVKKSEQKEVLSDCDIIIDCVYGFGYHGDLKEETATLFRYVNTLHKRVFSVDINSGCEADTAYCSEHALVSEITYALDCHKPFHMLRKEHHMFQGCELLDLGLPHDVVSYYPTMNEETFFAQFPLKNESAYKGSFGKLLLAGGSYGMAGAVSLNLIGAKTLGASYINCALEDCIYPIVATQHITPVFHPFSHDTAVEKISAICPQVSAVGYGSGVTNMSRKSEVLDAILQNSTCPVVIDAEGIRLLKDRLWTLRFIQCPVILTPHIGEFAHLINRKTSDVERHKIEYLSSFVKRYKVIVVLKGANTIIGFPNGKVYFNQSGSQALAQAGSGDVLTGMITAMLTLVEDREQAVIMAVWLHGYLSEFGLETQSMTCFSLESMPSLMNILCKKHNR